MHWGPASSNGPPNSPTTCWPTTVQTRARRGSRRRRSSSWPSGRSTPSRETITCPRPCTCCAIFHHSEPSRSLLRAIELDVRGKPTPCSTAAVVATHRARIGGGLGTRQDAACAVQRTCGREPSHLLDAHAAIGTPWAKNDHRSARIHAATFQRTTRELPVIERSNLDADCFMPRGGALRERPGWRFLFSYRGPA